MKEKIKEMLELHKAGRRDDKTTLIVINALLDNVNVKNVDFITNEKLEKVKPTLRNRKTRKPWTEQEDNFIKENKENMNYHELAKILDRGLWAVKERVYILRGGRKGKKIIGLIKRRPWTEREDNFLLQFRGKIGNAEIAKKLNRKTSAIHSRYYAIRNKRKLIEEKRILKKVPKVDNVYEDNIKQLES